MRKPDRIDFPLQCLRDIKRWLKSADVDGVVIGGVAAGLLGTPRVTHDVDVLVVIDEDVPTPEDLIILKVIPRRPNDLADIAELLHHHPRLDVDRIRRIAADFSVFLECPEIVDDLERLLLARRKKSKG